MSHFTPNYRELIRAQSSDGVRTLSSLWTPELRRPWQERDAAGELQLSMYLKLYEASGGDLEGFVSLFTEVLTRRVYDQIGKLTGFTPDRDMFLILTPPTQHSRLDFPESALLGKLINGARKLSVQHQDHDVRADFFQTAHSLELLLLRRWYRLPATPETGITEFDVALSSLGDAMEYYAPSQRFVDEALSRAKLYTDVEELLDIRASDELQKLFMKTPLDRVIEQEPLAAEISRLFFERLGVKLTVDCITGLTLTYRNGA